MTNILAGVDEVGRGSLAGPVIAVAVVFEVSRELSEVGDSKQMSAKNREKVSALLRNSALDWSIGAATSREIDQMNIHHASLLAMRRAVLGLRGQVDYVYVDGKYFPDIPNSGEAVVRGDQFIPVISAASIVAKVARDQQMRYLAKLYTGYGFEKHNGYSTPFHRDALRRFGPTLVHRMTYEPVKNTRKINQQSIKVLEATY